MFIVQALRELFCHTYTVILLMFRGLILLGIFNSTLKTLVLMALVPFCLKGNAKSFISFSPRVTILVISLFSNHSKLNRARFIVQILQ